MDALRREPVFLVAETELAHLAVAPREHGAIAGEREDVVHAARDLDNLTSQRNGPRDAKARAVKQLGDIQNIT